MERNRSNGIRLGLALAGIMLIVGGSLTLGNAGLLDGLFGKSPAGAAAVAGVVETAEEVRIPLKALDPGKALFFRAEAAGKTIHYFAVKSSDGIYRAAYDACDVCFRMNRGYRQEADLMICNNCGQSFPTDKINEAKGGCNPAPLARKVEGQHLVIKKADIAAGKDYFVRKRS